MPWIVRPSPRCLLALARPAAPALAVFAYANTRAPRGVWWRLYKKAAWWRLFLSSGDKLHPLRTLKGDLRCTVCTGCRRQLIKGSAGRLMAAFLFAEYSSTLNSQLFAGNSPFMHHVDSSTKTFRIKSPFCVQNWNFSQQRREFSICLDSVETITSLHAIYCVHAGRHSS